jgi:hypothetical protein
MEMLSKMNSIQWYQMYAQQKYFAVMQNKKIKNTYYGYIFTYAIIDV